MRGEIQCISDFLTGTYLITSIPEEEVDLNALNTIQEDCPDFILPFHYKRENGQVELTYKVGKQSKLQYFAGEFSPREYSKLWQSVINPLLECEDWFMHPHSFMLCVDHIYYDKNKKAVSYVYIPTVNGCSGYDALQKMVINISKIITVSDSDLENKVLRTILSDFNPSEFLEMLKDHVSEDIKPVDITTELLDQYKKESMESADNYKEESNGIAIVAEKKRSTYETKSSTKPQYSDEDKFFEVLPGFNVNESRKEAEPEGYRIFSGRSKKKRASNQRLSEKVAEKHDNDKKPQAISISSNKEHAEVIENTQNLPIINSGPGLRYVGRAGMPQSILIPIAEGEMFTIGRFDVTIGKKQSNFEFDKRTKAVSRRHAVVERDINGYKIVDLSSSAGTYVNDKKIHPNTPCTIETGCKISFGNAGADYIWEVS